MFICGEIFVLILINGVICLLFGIVGKEVFLIVESFSIDLLDYFYYIRLLVFWGLVVFLVLFFGNY